MGQTILSAIGVYISTSIDYLFILIILFSQTDKRNQIGHIYAGQYLGTAVLVGVSLLAAYLVNFIPEEWMIGLLGFIPIYLGIRFALVGEEEEEEEEILEKIQQNKESQLFWTVTLLTLASGGDNLGVYIPYFSSLNGLQISVALVIFALGVLVLCALSRAFAQMPFVSETIEQYEKIIVPFVFVLLGVYILYENGTFQYLLSFFS